MASEDKNNAAKFSPIHENIWKNERHQVRCIKIVDETWDVRTFYFVAANIDKKDMVFFFKAGQFVTLELSIDDQQVMRSYTISSSPSLPYSFSITVKRIPNGKVSNWLHDNLQINSEIAIHGPVGVFNCIDHPASKVLLLSGGVGITPLMSMARWFCDTQANVDVAFSHSARSPKDIIYKRELEQMCADNANFSLHLVCENYSSGEAWFGYRGFLDTAKLAIMVPDFLEREIFCCGPTPYMDAVKKILSSHNFNMDNYHEELFISPDDSINNKSDGQESQPIQQESSELTEISFAKANKRVMAKPEETIHEAAARVDVNIPKACGMGLCGTCKVFKLEGEVTMNDDGGITDEDKEAGFILSCCSVARGPVSIDF